MIIIAEQYAMLIRMLFPLFRNPENSKFYLLLCYITEPIIIPIREAVCRIEYFRTAIIDWGFTITYLILVSLGYILPAI